MPYKIRKKGNEWCVYNKATGDNKGCSASPDMALKHMRKLYMVEDEKKELTPESLDELIIKAVEDYQDETGETIEADMVEKALEEKGWYYEADTPVWTAAITYNEYEQQLAAEDRLKEANKLLGIFPALARNIIYRDDLDNKADAVEYLAGELATRLRSLDESGNDDDYDKALAEVEALLTSVAEDKEVDNLDELVEKAMSAVLEQKAISKREDVSEADKKRAVKKYGNIQFADTKNKKYALDTEAHIRAAWSYINMPKNQKKYSSSEVSAIKSRIISAWKSKIDKAGPPAAKKSRWEEAVQTVKEAIVNALSNFDNTEDQEQSLTFWEKDGLVQWIGRYSNNFRDRDNPPEIISADSHRRFVERVEKGLAPAPELLVWHIKDWKVGKSTWVGYDDEGFAMAAGYILPGCEHVIKDRDGHYRDWKLSHGMPNKSIKRDLEDETIIIEHDSAEISLLPSYAAANELTGFHVIKEKTEEDTMALSKDQKAKLLGEWGIDATILENIEAINVKDAQKAHEEGIESKELKDTDTDLNKVNEPEAAKKDETGETPDGDVEEIEPNQEMLEGNPTRKEIANAITAVLGPQLDAIKSLEERFATMEETFLNLKKEITNRERLEKEAPPATLSQLLQQSLVGSRETLLSDDDELTKVKPKETDPNAVPVYSGVPFIDQFIAQG